MMQPIRLILFALLLIVMPLTAQTSAHFDWQGHRGCRGLLPENSIPAFLHALDFAKITTLELDVVASADGKVVISHEAWMNHEIATKPNGEAVTAAEEKHFNLYKMTYDEIRQFDCGKRGHVRFPEQRALPTVKPTLEMLVGAVSEYCQKHHKTTPFYNIEIKTEGATGDYQYHPEPATFVKIVLDEIKRLNIEKYANIQSFDTRILNEVKKQNANIKIALLVENQKGLSWNLKQLNFKPDIYSCYFLLLTKKVVNKCHKKEIKVIPWTVNTTKDMKNLIDMGVDGIITDYPNLIP
jgi:glycerophosphoryl diester phosphodiesterase